MMMMMIGESWRFWLYNLKSEDLVRPKQIMDLMKSRFERLEKLNLERSKLVGMVLMILLIDSISVLTRTNICERVQK